MIDYKKYGDRLVVGVSGGKDSTAVCLHLLEQGLTKSDFDRVFIDTGWESSCTYEYIDRLQADIGSIIKIKKEIPIPKEHKEFCMKIENRLGFESPFVRRILKGLIFSNPKAKWCTPELKTQPLKKYFDTLDYDPINVVGIRREESRRRAALAESEWDDHLDCYVYRPILDWSFDDVVAIHKRFGIIPNRLYFEANQKRVGCFPCIFQSKKAITGLSEDRVEIIEELERYVTAHKGRESTFLRQGRIRDVYLWSKTSYGGRQFELFDLRERGCEKWGMCGV